MMKGSMRFHNNTEAQILNEDIGSTKRKKKHNALSVKLKLHPQI